MDNVKLKQNRSSISRREASISHGSQLNVIYFVDANKTRSLKISLRSAIILLIFLALVMLWSLSSLLVLTRQMKAIHRNETRISSLLDIIFDYQCRYDHAFDRAYPQNQTHDKGLPVAAEFSKKTSTVTSPPPHEPQKPRTEQIAQEPKETPKDASDENVISDLSTQSPQTEEARKVPGENFNVSVDALKVALFSNKLQVRFAMRNTDSPSQNEGYVMGVAKFETEDGTTIYIPTPSNINVDPTNGSPNSMKLGYRFSIKYYKKRTMEFLSPAGKSGHFVSANIFTSHDNTPQGNFEIKIPPDQSIESKADVTDKNSSSAEAPESEGTDP